MLDSEERLIEGDVEVTCQQAAEEHDSWVCAAEAGGRGVGGVGGRGGAGVLAVH